MSPKFVIVHENLNILPIGEVLEWKKFEQFCTDVLASRLNIVNAREYLQQGNDQEGIDIYAIQSGVNELIVAQCKLKAYISPQEVRQIIDLFLAGKFQGQAKEFILCTNYDLTKLKDEEEVIGAVRAKLMKYNIDLVIWDSRGLSAHLRRVPQPQIVARYFGPEIAKAFYGPIYEESLVQYLKVDKRNYPVNEHHIERRVISYSNYLQRSEISFHYRIDNTQNHKLKDLFRSPSTPDGFKVILLSIAGYGKTWEMENLAAHFSKSEELLLPVRNYLKDYQGQPIGDILAIFSKDWERIPGKSLLLIFDGLDEIKEEYYQVFINHLNQFCEARPLTNVVVSTRYNFYSVSSAPLRSFQPFILESFDTSDINEYIENRLSTKQLLFREKVEHSGFSEYLANPYYLARLVGIYDAKEDFPKNKASLFNRILFERLKKDRNKYKLTEDRELCFSLAQKVAFCMTMLGKSSLDEEQILPMLGETKYVKLFKHFFLMNKSGNMSESWSFEHKNLQEYLCASFLLEHTFCSILPLVTFNFDEPKLQIKFLNTFSFLFAIADTDSMYFKELFEWLNTNEPELLIRFEKDRIPMPKRKEIFKRILDYYEDRNIMLFASSNFRVNELADFVEIDNETIDYLDSVLLRHPSDWLVRDCIELLAECRRPFIYEARLKQILFRELSDSSAESRHIESVIAAFEALSFFTFVDVNNVMRLHSTTESFVIRKALVSYINAAELADSYPDFLLESIMIYQWGQEAVNELFADDKLKKVILSLKKAESLIKVLNHGAYDQEFIGLDGSEELKLDASDISEILKKSAYLYPQNNRMLGAVYKLFRKLQHVSIHTEWLTPFRDFFSGTCGLKTVFKKLYRYEKYSYDMMSMADAESSEFLIDEYKEGKISVDQMVNYRNLARYSPELYEEFYKRLLEEFGDVFLVKDIGFDYEANLKAYELKNQQFLLDRNLFLQEVEAIFRYIGLDAMTAADLYSVTGYYLNSFTPSLAFSEIRKRARKIPISITEVLACYETDDQWESFKIDQIMHLLENRKQKERIIDRKLMDFAISWTRNNIERLDYSRAVRDNGGQTTVDGHIAFTNKMYLLLRFPLPDNLLLKLLLADYNGGFQAKKSLSKVVLDKTVDRQMLKETVLKNIKNGLASAVLLTHFSICSQLRFKECLSELYQSITNNKCTHEHDKTKLIDYYLSLGGQIEDFASFLKLPDPIGDPHGLFWEWHLIKELLPKMPESVLPILEGIISEPAYSDHHKLLACELLLSQKKIEGLKYWLNYLKTNHKTAFDYRQQPILTYCPEMPIDETIPIFIEALDFVYRTGLNKTTKFPDSPVDAIYNALSAISKISVEAFKMIMDEMKSLITKFNTELFVRDISYYKQQIINGFYQSHHSQLCLDQVLENYHQITTENTGSNSNLAKGVTI